MAKKKVTVKELVEKAIVDCFRVVGNGEYCISVDVMSHINGVTFLIYEKGWKVGVYPNYSIIIYLDGGLKPTVKECRKMLKPIYDLINKNK